MIIDISLISYISLCSYIHKSVQRLPYGDNFKAFVGTMTLLSFCAAPVFLKNTKTGHDLFSQEKPQAIVDSERELRKGYMDSKK